MKQHYPLGYCILLFDINCINCISGSVLATVYRDELTRLYIKTQVDFVFVVSTRRWFQHFLCAQLNLTGDSVRCLGSRSLYSAVSPVNTDPRQAPPQPPFDRRQMFLHTRSKLSAGTWGWIQVERGNGAKALTIRFGVTGTQGSSGCVIFCLLFSRVGMLVFVQLFI